MSRLVGTKFKLDSLTHSPSYLIMKNYNAVSTEKGADQKINGKTLREYADAAKTVLIKVEGAKRGQQLFEVSSWNT